MNRFILRDYPVSIKPEPAELAEVWWSLKAAEQIEFLNHLAEISNGKLPFQLQVITDGEGGVELTAEARYVLQLFGDYAEKQKR